MKKLMSENEFSGMMKTLVNIPSIHTNDTVKLRKFVEAIYYMSRAGCAWRLLPECYGQWRTVHKRFVAWNRRNIWQKIFENVQIDPDMEYVMLDSTIVRSHACSSGYKKDSQATEALGRSRGGFTTKIHALTDALGNPLKFVLTAGQRNDITQAELLSEGIFNTPHLADKGYDSKAFAAGLVVRGCTPIIPSRVNSKQPRSYDEHIYKERSCIEICFGKMKHFRRIFSRFDKAASSYLAFVYFVGALIWLR